MSKVDSSRWRWLLAVILRLVSILSAGLSGDNHPLITVIYLLVGQDNSCSAGDVDLRQRKTTGGKKVERKIRWQLVINYAKGVRLVDFIRFLSLENSFASVLTWLLSTVDVNEDQIKRGRRRGRIPKTGGERATSRNIQIWAGTAVFRTTAGEGGGAGGGAGGVRGGGQSSQWSHTCSCIQRPLGATAASRNIRCWKSCCLFSFQNVNNTKPVLN